MRIVPLRPNNRSVTDGGAEAAIRPLLRLPVFLDLNGKRAVVIGGSDAAAWKAELLAMSGAAVEICSGTVSERMDRLLARTNLTGSVRHDRRDWTGETLLDASVVVADVSNETEARAVHDAAKSAGVPVNVIDRPAFCDFQFGSIVNRSPVVIGISTSGAAPVLGQAIRRRIETLLPASLADWGALALRLRDSVAVELRPGVERRRFWEAFVRRAFRGAPEKTSGQGLLAEARRSTGAGAITGRVTLVGAGPGDAELLTLKAVRALQAADVILFDSLVSADVLELARREARRMLVGKRAGRPSCRQDDINATMIALAKAGKHVVRLKSGDPMIFGRAGEEITTLEAHGIAVDIVPGITAALALAASLGVSLTHRDHARSVRFVTAHGRNGGLPEDIDWKTQASGTCTTIFYMGARTVDQLVARLLRQGASADLAAVAAAAVGRPNEARWCGPLRDLAQGVGTLDRDEPILLGIGDVFQARSGVAGRGAETPISSISATRVRHHRPGFEGAACPEWSGRQDGAPPLCPISSAW